MTRTAKASLFGIAAAGVAAGVWLLWPDGGGGDSPVARDEAAAAPSRAGHGNAGARHHSPEVSRRASAAPSFSSAPEVSRARSKSRRMALARLEREWTRALSAGLGPAELAARQREIAMEAVETLGPGPALERFLAFLVGLVLPPAMQGVEQIIGTPPDGGSPIFNIPGSNVSYGFQLSTEIGGLGGNEVTLYWNVKIVTGNQVVWSGSDAKNLKYSPKP